MIPVHVECYSGYTYAQEPRFIARHGLRSEVVRVVKSWRTPAGPAFRVCLDDGTLVELQYHEQRDEWLLDDAPHLSPKD